MQSAALPLFPFGYPLANRRPQTKLCRQRADESDVMKTSFTIILAFWSHGDGGLRQMGSRRVGGRDRTFIRTNGAALSVHLLTSASLLLDPQSD